MTPACLLAGGGRTGNALLVSLSTPLRVRSGPAPWWTWKRGGTRYTVGAEEEAFLLRASDLSLSHSSDLVLARVSRGLAEHCSPETHAAVLELVSSIHPHAGAVAAELAALRERLALELRPLGLLAASAGLHPLAGPEETSVSGDSRYRLIADSMRSLARREPTAALHVHIGVPDPEDAIRLVNRLREHVPVLIALSANSPFSHGRDTGFDSGRTLIFDGFPRTGIPRRFEGYADYVETVDTLISSGAIPDPTFLWWDVRLQPALGTVEVRGMDAQSEPGDSAALIALIQSMARLELEGEPRREHSSAPEILAENRFLAVRDGVRASLIDPASRRRVGLQTLVRALVSRCYPHAAALGCVTALDRVHGLLNGNGAARQRAWASAHGDAASVVSMLAERFETPLASAA
jgi:glutamate---cysteine ligase / carboxylate-amine ligase